MTAKIIGLAWHEDCKLSALRWALRFNDAGHSVRMITAGEPWGDTDAILIVNAHLPLDKFAKTAVAVNLPSMRLDRLLSDLRLADYEMPRKGLPQRGIYYASVICNVDGCASPFHMANCFICKKVIDNARNSHTSASAAQEAYAAAQAAY